LKLETWKLQLETLPWTRRKKRRRKRRMRTRRRRRGGQEEWRVRRGEEEIKQPHLEG